MSFLFKPKTFAQSLKACLLERVEKVTDVVNIGDVVKVKVIKIDEKGRIDLKLVKKA